MDVGTIANIETGKTDATGAQIKSVYSKIAGVFAVYRTSERVVIQYADDQALGLEQRRALAPLNPLRGEINGLVDDWRNSDRPEDRCRARLFDRRTADALIAALQGDQVHGEELLKAVRADVVEERTSIGRVEYLRYASLASLAIFLLFGLLSFLLQVGLFPSQVAETLRNQHLWLASGLGCLGALFSIALSIRARDIRTDLQRRDNIADAILRILIGSVSAVILFAFLKSDFVRIEGLEIGDAEQFNIHVAIIVAFLAGFSERLVADYLTRAADGSRTSAPAGSGMTSAAAQAAAQSEIEATERNPRGRLEFELLGAGAVQARRRDPHAHDLDPGQDEETDGCVCDVEIVPAELTHDVELPEASGGVEKAA